jgi:hypothetical protein
MLPTPLPNPSSCDSLNVDTVVADDRDGMTVLPADPEALARFLAECRRLERGTSKEKPGS